LKKIEEKRGRHSYILLGMLIHTLPSLVGATVLRRPSAYIRSPYVADIELDDGTLSQCYSPGLGCGGLIAPGKRIYVSENYDDSVKADWIAQISEGLSTMIGIHPTVTHQAIHPLLHKIHPDAEWTTNLIVKYSRIDYVGYCPDGKRVYVQIKTVLADPINRVIVSADQANTEINILNSLMDHPETHSCHLLFVVPRPDCDAILIDPKNTSYHSKLLDALKKGMKHHAFTLEYDADGDIHYKKKIRIRLG